MADTIKQFAQLYASLVQEKNDLEARLEEINKALSGQVTTPRRGRPKKSKKKSAKKKAAPKNGRRKRGRKKKAVTEKKAEPKNGRKKKAKTKTSSTKKRAKNKTSLRVAIKSVLGKKRMSKDEILEGVIASGYKFSAKNPMNSLQVQLYTKFKKDKDKKFHV